MPEHETITMQEMAIEMRLSVSKLRSLRDKNRKHFPKAINEGLGCKGAVYSYGDFLAWKAQYGYTGRGIDKTMSLSFLTMKPVEVSYE